MNEERKEFVKWSMLALFVTVITLIVFAALSYSGKYTGTVVERKVFEQSYQKQAGDDARMRAYRAQLAMINNKIYTETDEQILNDLRAQKAMLEVQINAGKF